ncbi:hypothetical protein CRE_24363 [Caenorhabditis remanei]|uniref:Uncharacterized protein n=1 Tax=Caenorhabditis remanei TaxID=31234 RepID=E3NV48_CAERE|nr:hypothetical protein CRE_24363 [Caenorhabditis remanei]
MPGGPARCRPEPGCAPREPVRVRLSR